MNNLTISQRATLRHQGIEVVIEHITGTAVCRVRGQRRVYALDDLRMLANRRPLSQRLWSWLSGRVAA